MGELINKPWMFNKVLKKFHQFGARLRWSKKFEEKYFKFEEIIPKLQELDINFIVFDHRTDDEANKEYVTIDLTIGEYDPSVGALGYYLATLEIYQDGDVSYNIIDLKDYVKDAEKHKESKRHINSVQALLRLVIPSIYGFKNLKDKNPLKQKLKGGLADKCQPKDFNQKALKKGIKVEMEHTNDKNIATEIAMDHLAEDPDYYDMLAIMENPASFIKNKNDEKLWNKAKEAVMKARDISQDEFEDLDWGLATKIFKNLKEKRKK